MFDKNMTISDAIDLFNKYPNLKDDIYFEKISTSIIKFLESKQKEIEMNKISYDEFEKYYRFLKIVDAVDRDNWFSFKHTLTNADVVINSDMEKSKFLILKEDLDNMIAKNLRTSLNIKHFDLKKSYENAKQQVSTEGHGGRLDFEDYCNLCEDLRLAIPARLDEELCFECATFLLNTPVSYGYTPFRVLEEIKVDHYHRDLICNYLKTFVQEKTNSVKK